MNVDDSIIERAAIAAAEVYGDVWDQLVDVNPLNTGELDRKYYRDTVRAILLSIREPSEAMCEAGGIAGCWDDHLAQAGATEARQVWQAMIDAALGQATQP